MLIPLYQSLTTLAHPLMRLYLHRRKQRGKEHPERMKERLGRSDRPRPEGKLLWMHAASVGETNALLPLLNRILSDFPHIHILLTTGTVSSAALVMPKLPPRAIHQFYPVDTPIAVKRFLAHWKPDAVIWTESEIWPNMLLYSRKQNIPLALVNARMSPGSFARWQHLNASIRKLLDCFQLVAPQSSDDCERFRQLGAQNVHDLGNLKHDSPVLPTNQQEQNKLAEQIGNRPVWLAASTHPSEEIQLAVTHRILHEKHDDLLTIIVPRHAHRGEEIAQTLQATGITTALRSKEDYIKSSTQIYIADTMGELGIFYRLANIVFVGGSLIPHGGQNPLEPARLHCAILVGPHTQNFTAICHDLEACGGLKRIKDAAELAHQVERIIEHPITREAMSVAALALASEKQGALERVCSTLHPLLEKALMPNLQGQEKEEA